MNRLFDFDPDALVKYSSNYDSKILKGGELNDSEKIALGKDLGKVVKISLQRITSSAIDQITSKNQRYKDRAEIYIKYLKGQSILSKGADMVDSIGKETLAPEKFREDKENQNKILAKLLGIDTIPDIPEERIKINSRFWSWSPKDLEWFYKTMQVQKIDLLSSLSVNLESVKEVDQQHQNFPLLMSFVNEIKSNLTALDDCYLQNNQEAANLLQDKIKKQINNLVSLSQLIKELNSTDEDAKALIKLTALDLEGIDPILKGEVSLSDENIRDKLFGILHDNIKQINEEKVEEKEVKYIKAIPKQAQLIGVKRQGKRFAAHQNQPLVPLGTSANKVYKLKDLEANLETIAFCKEGEKDEQAMGKMEKFVWDFAVWLGSHERFVPTGRVQLNETEQVKQSIQPAQKGASLADFRTQQKAINDDEVMEALVDQLVFGMYDAHEQNIWITKEEKIRFFDNTRSLPHSNVALDRGGFLVSPFRSALLGLSSAEKSFTPDQIKKLKEKIKIIKENLSNIKNFFDNPQTKSVIDSLPPEWLDPKKVVLAMKDRVLHIENALEKNSANNLLELTAQVFPTYKFFFALQYIVNFSNALADPYLTHNAIGFESLDVMINLLANKGYDIKQIFAWSLDRNISFSDLTKNLKTHFRNITSTTLTPDELILRMEAATDILLQFKEESVYDFKDWSRQTIRSVIKQLNAQELSGIHVIPQVDINKAIKYFQKQKSNNLLVRLDDLSYCLLVKSPNGKIRKQMIDPFAKVGFICFPHNKGEKAVKPIEIGNFPKWIQDQTVLEA